MYWVNFLHIYQPPNQHKDLLRKIVEQCYKKIIQILKKNPTGKLTLNISGCLTEQLAKEGYGEIIKDLIFLAKRNQIEFTETAEYHAFLPLLPENEIERQIKLNHQTNKIYFKDVYQPKGFHLPEMAYSKKTAEIIKKLGYSWLILNEVSFEGKLFSKIDSSKIYKLKGIPEIKIFFRNRKISDLIQRGIIWQPEEFYKAVKEEIKENEYLLTAMDGETFGHHRPGLERFLEKIYEENKIETKNVSELFQLFPINNEVEPIPGTWASMESEIKKKIYYAQWKYPGNPIQKKQWELTYLAIKTINNSQSDPNYKKARKMLDMGLFSCQYWWAGAVPWWEIEYIEKGAYFLKESINLLKKASPKIKKRAEKLYQEIVFTAFDWERSGLAHKKSMDYTQKIIKELKEKIPASPLFNK